VSLLEICFPNNFRKRTPFIGGHFVAGTYKHY